MSIQSRLIQAFMRMSRRSGLSNEALVKHTRANLNHTPVVTLLPKGVRLTQIHSPYFEGDYLSTFNPEVTVLYIHGGAYVAGVTRTYHNLAGRLAKKLNGEVYLVTYPFAPEHPFPAAVNRCLDAYQYLLESGRKPENIVIAGDSAGGALTLATLLHIRDNQLPLPRCAVALSPASNCLADEQEMATRDATDAMLSARMISQFTEIYVPHEEDRHHPYASPAFGDYTGLPPLFILTTPEEVLYSHAVQVREKAEQDGIKVRWFERTGVFHVWPIMVPFLPEANRDLKRIVAFIQRPG